MGEQKEQKGGEIALSQTFSLEGAGGKREIEGDPWCG